MSSNKMNCAELGIKLILEQKGFNIFYCLVFLQKRDRVGGEKRIEPKGVFFKCV